MDIAKTTEIIREKYGALAKGQSGSCCGSGCGCGPANSNDLHAYVKSLGYSQSELQEVPADANLALGCGNPTSIAGLKEGEVVLDLGSGAGFDCFLASSRVGPQGRIIGVDMTPEMVERARAIAKQEKFDNVEFRLGEIENLPVPDNSVDAVISNCVINLSTDKNRVFREIARVLKPGGRIAISDIALIKALPEKIRSSIEAYVGCVAGAVLVEDYNKLVEDAGLTGVKININHSTISISPDTNDPLARVILESLNQGQSLDDYIVSVYVEGFKSK